MGALKEWPAPDFDLRLTLASGQVFHWREENGVFHGTIGDQATAVSQCGNALQIHGGDPSRVAHYFALDHPMTEIEASLPRDEAMQRALAACRGVRIIRQPIWECLATFITSSMKQVAHIRQMSLALRERFGEVRTVGGRAYALYPSAGRLALASESELRECGLGYRAKNLRLTAARVADGGWLQELGELDDRELRTALCAFPGVGAKVANCVMLFAYERLGAFPVDVWIERVLRAHYLPRRRKLTAGKIQAFADAHFGPYGGYAQQYLFHAARLGGQRR